MHEGHDKVIGYFPWLPIYHPQELKLLSGHEIGSVQIEQGSSSVKRPQIEQYAILSLRKEIF